MKLSDLKGIGHLLDDTAQLLVCGTVFLRPAHTVVLVDTGTHRDRSGRYVNWLVNDDHSCMLGHYTNDLAEAYADTFARISAYLSIKTGNPRKELP